MDVIFQQECLISKAFSDKAAKKIIRITYLYKVIQVTRDLPSLPYTIDRLLDRFQMSGSKADHTPLSRLLNNHEVDSIINR